MDRAIVGSWQAYSRIVFLSGLAGAGKALLHQLASIKTELETTASAFFNGQSSPT